MKRSTVRFALLSSMLALAAAACGGKQDGGGGGGGAGATAAKQAELPASAILTSEPAGATPVKDARAAARSGDTVVATGVVGDTGADAAFFTLVDESVKSCKSMGDPCPTPWDYCCTSPEELARVSATVEFRDGKDPRPGSLVGVHGIDHLVTVVVSGTAEKDSAGNLTIVASGIFVRR